MISQEPRIFSDFEKEIHRQEHLSHESSSVHEECLRVDYLERSASFRDYSHDFLESIISDFSLSGAIVYVPDFYCGTLRFFYGRNSEEGPLSPESLIVSLDYSKPDENEGPFEAHVFWSDSFKIESVRGSNMLDQKHRELFGENSTVIGIPLRILSNSLGVLLCWSEERRSIYSNADLMFSRGSILASCIASSYERQRRFAVSRAVERISYFIQTNGSSETVCEYVLQAALNLQLDDVRLYVFDPNAECFVWKLTGTDSMRGDSVKLQDRPIPVSYRDSPHLFFMFSRMPPHLQLVPPGMAPNAKANGATSGEAETDESPRTESFPRMFGSFAGAIRQSLTTSAADEPSHFSVLFPRLVFGPDPFTQLAECDPDLPWLVAPIVFGNRCFGFMSADNRSSKRQIDLDAAAQFGILGGFCGAAMLRVQRNDSSITRMIRQFTEHPHYGSPSSERHWRTESGTGGGNDQLVVCSLGQSHPQYLDARSIQLGGDHKLDDLSRLPYNNGMNVQDTLTSLFANVADSVSQISCDNQKYESYWKVSFPKKSARRLVRFCLDNIRFGAVEISEDFPLKAFSINAFRHDHRTIVVRFLRGWSQQDLEGLGESVLREGLVDVEATPAYDDLLGRMSYEEAAAELRALKEPPTDQTIAFNHS